MADLIKSHQEYERPAAPEFPQRLEPEKETPSITAEIGSFGLDRRISGWVSETNH